MARGPPPRVPLIQGRAGEQPQPAQRPAAFAARRQLIPQILPTAGRAAGLRVPLSIDAAQSGGIAFEEGEFVIPVAGPYQVHYAISVYNSHSRDTLHAGVEWLRSEAPGAPASYVDWTQAAVDVPPLNTVRINNTELLHFAQGDRLALHFWAESVDVHLSSNFAPSGAMHSVASVFIQHLR